VSLSEEESGVCFIDPAAVGSGESGEEEIEQKVVLINQLLALLQSENRQI
jgi:hypothetical protein